MPFMVQSTPSQNVDSAITPDPKAQTAPHHGHSGTPGADRDSNEAPAYYIPPHSKTKSTLAPTDEFTRIFLLAWGVRYIARGLIGEAFEPRTFDWLKVHVNNFIRMKKWGPLTRWVNKVNTVLTENAAQIQKFQQRIRRGEPVATGHLGQKVYLTEHPLADLRAVVREWRMGGGSGSEVEEIIKNAKFTKVKGKTVVTMGDASVDKWHDYIRARIDDMAYSIVLGLGSTWLSFAYTGLVRRDIKGIFREAVAYEKDIPQEKVTFEDIKSSQNDIIRSTMKHHRSRMFKRFGTDALFFLVTPLKSMHLTDVVLGTKALQVFLDTWNRKTTMFEDIVSFVNNKINPRNGLGQPITVGELFDLYQHYTEIYHPEDMFSNVLSKQAVEYDVWAKSQPVFQRIADLMNRSYAYKHSVTLDASGKATNVEDFTLPKLIYLMGHNLIQPREPKRTLATIEIANRYGIKAVKDMYAMLEKGSSLEAVIKKYPVSLTALEPAKSQEAAAGSPLIKKGATAPTTQIDQATPDTRVQANSVQPEQAQPSVAPAAERAATPQASATTPGTRITASSALTERALQPLPAGHSTATV